MWDRDPEGERLRTVRTARMPESKKRTLKQQPVAEVENAFRQQPHLRLVKVADGARDSWEFLAKELPPGVEVVDFYHGAEHLKRAFDHAYGEGGQDAAGRYDMTALKHTGDHCRSPVVTPSNPFPCLLAVGRHGFRDFRLHGIEVET